MKFNATQHNIQIHLMQSYLFILYPSIYVCYILYDVLHGFIYIGNEFVLPRKLNTRLNNAEINAYGMKHGILTVSENIPSERHQRVSCHACMCTASAKNWSSSSSSSSSGTFSHFGCRSLCRFVCKERERERYDFNIYRQEGLMCHS